MTRTILRFRIVKPTGRQTLWRVHGYKRGRLVATWKCDSQDIARLVAKRLRKGRSPGWAAHDLRYAK